MSLLGPPWEGRHVLDCFAGSGAYGFEALSRGADAVVFVDRSAEVTRELATTAQTFGVEERVRIERGDVVAVLPRLAGKTFDLVFLDPPYESDLLEPALAGVAALVGDDTRIVAEHPASRPPPDAVGRLTCVDRRRYGDTGIAIFERTP